MSSPPAPASTWTSQDALELYRVDRWGRGYVGVSEQGTLLVHPTAQKDHSVDLHQLVMGLRSRDIHAPVLVRFSQVLEHRLREFRRTFDEAITEAGYGGSYRLVYPIKVNQQRHLCEEVREVGGGLGFGFEVGSKPELIAGLALTAPAPQMPIYCNGFKDEEYLTLAILASKLGRTVVPIIEQFSELEILTRLAAEYDVRPRIGVRARLNASGVGRWHGSAGAKGKFGLSMMEILAAVQHLQTRGMLDALEVLHCHVGSQVHDIRAVKNAVTEMARLYVELRGLGAPISTVDFGGGLAVDYDGSRSAREASMNYDLAEYAADLVFRLRDICDEAGEPHPDIVTESGRAVMAYSSVLVVDVLGSRSLRTLDADFALDPEEEDCPPLRDLRAALESVKEGGDLRSVYHDAQHAWEEAALMFSIGEIGLVLRSRCEALYWAVAAEILERVPRPLPEDLDDLPELMADVYFCNFSLFQSLPDAWAIDQLFPIVPLSRLNEQPDRLATLADITCDSDGKIDRFIPGTTEKPVLELHGLESGAGSDPYHLGIFLVGAYQETLGDLHNLLGDTHAVHVRSDGGEGWTIEEVVEGDSVRDVLGYVQFRPDDMRRTLRMDVETAIREGRLSVSEGTALRRSYEAGLEGYTYMES